VNKVKARVLMGEGMESGSLEPTFKHTVDPWGVKHKVQAVRVKR